jgi:trk system potassium uptake protein TrkH
MNLFESVCHAFGTVATGGFSPKNTSIIAYSPYIQYVITLFMFLAGTNFVIHYYLFKREFQKVKENEELKFYIMVVFTIIAIITASLYFSMQKPLEESFREAAFQVVSIVTCTGFASADYLLWPAFAWTIIFFSMFLGGSTGSTAGGIKMVRHLIMLKNIKRNFSHLISPNAILPIRLNKNAISNETNRSILTFIGVYFLVFLMGSALLVLLGIDGETASSSVATCMAGIGPGIGTVGPVSNFAHLPDMGKIILSFVMILGRLEIYTVIVLFSASFWRK